ncbi:MAG: T9SS type A sorting domain-containing protein [Bacteroidota bacterium]
MIYRFFCLIFPLIPGISLTGLSQTDYPNGNQAYNSEFLFGYNSVTIAGGSLIYIFDETNRVYRSGTEILIPDLTGTTDGNHVNETGFFGFGTGGVPCDSCFQWDRQTLIAQPDVFDMTNLFVSPVSQNGMTYGKAIQYTNDTCYYDDCLALIDGPDSSLVYMLPPYQGIYNLWAGEELINAGDLKGTGTDQKISQQQSDTTANSGYCPCTYGPGWRLPSDIEAGHFNDLEGSGNGLDDGYTGTDSSYYMWTSSLFKTFNVKRWPVRLTDGYWENCAGFLNVENRVRCVFSAQYGSTMADRKKDTGNVAIFPNPANDVVFVEGLLENARIEIYTPAGIMIMRPVISAGFGIDISALPAGFYMIKIVQGGRTIIHRLIVV